MADLSYYVVLLLSAHLAIAIKLSVSNTFYCNTRSGDCERLDARSSAEANANAFSSRTECLKQCKAAGNRSERSTSSTEQNLNEHIPAKCLLDLNLGKRAGFDEFHLRETRYWYNKKSDECEAFTYLRGGNDNNFMSKPDCEDVCKPDPPTPSQIKKRVWRAPHLCYRHRNFGRGHRHIAQYWYDVECRCCKEFTYSGHGGNNNRFWTKAECEQTCKPPSNLTTETADSDGSGQGMDNQDPASTNSTDRCLLPQRIGGGTSAVTRYSFNPVCQCCIAFTYFGHDGNKNRFDTKRKCEENCGQHYVNPCLLSIDEGSGLNIDGRYGYDAMKGRCRIFTYHGQGGNGNNFDSWTKCHQTCGRVHNQIHRPTTNPTTTSSYPTSENLSSPLPSIVVAPEEKFVSNVQSWFLTTSVTLSILIVLIIVIGSLMLLLTWIKQSHLLESRHLPKPAIV